LAGPRLADDPPEALRGFQMAGSRTGWRAVAVVSAAFLLAACGRDPPRPGRFDPLEIGQVVAAVVQGPDTYFMNPEGKPAGLEYDLLQGFAKSLGVSLTFRFFTDYDEALRAGEEGLVHVVAVGAGGAPPPGALAAGPGYQSVQPVVVYRIDTPAPAGWQDMGKAAVLTTPDQPTAEFSADDPKITKESVRFVSAPSARIVAESIVDGKATYGVLFRHTLAFLRNVYLDIDAAFPVGRMRELRWRMPKSNVALAEEVDRYFSQVRKDGTLARLLDRYYGHTQRVDAQAAEAFQTRILRLLPEFRDLFQLAQERTGIEWRLLAAIAYQESQWDAQATSPTNVRGMMMLTEETSTQFKVTDRLDPAQSVAAGAQLVAKLKNALPERIPEPDRTWLALAAFNVGLAHLEDARVLAQHQRLNPDSWTDIKKSLPQLARPDGAAQAKHGFARGGQAVIFVENIRALYDILAHLEAQYVPAVTVPEPPPLPSPPSMP
ncbi:MAG: membrane-bound lytic murein transglycosylase MltF, partial [Betaproteobacteria bacterium]